MKKTIVALAVVATCGVGGYFINDFMVDKVAQEVVNNVERFAHDASDSYVDIQVVESEIDGHNVAQKFAVYFIDGTKRHSQPIYVSHSAKIALFGSKVEGRLTLPKDKGLSAKFIQEVTSFNENIHYTFTPYNKAIDLKSSLNVGVISDGSRRQLKFGEVNFDLAGTLEDNKSKFTVDGIEFTERKESINLGTVAVETIVSPTLQSSTISLDKGQLIARQGGVNVSDIQLKTEAVIEEDTSLNYDWSVGSFDLDSPDITLLSSKFGMQGTLAGISTATLIELGSALESNKTNNAEKLFKDILGNGLEFSSINLYLNDSSVTGHIELNKADYSTLRSYEVQRLLERSVSSELDIVLTPQMIEKLKVPSRSLEKLWTVDENQNYTTKFKLALGKATINGVNMN